MLARCAVLPCPSPASGPQVLLLSKLKGRLNHAESTLLQVFFLKNLKPFGITTFRKTGEGVVVMVNHLLETSHPLLPQLCDSVSPWPTRLPFSVHTSKFRMPQPLCLPLLRKHRGVGIFFPFWNSLFDRRFDLTGGSRRFDLWAYRDVPAHPSPAASPTRL